MFDIADADYDNFMGRYSTRLAPLFADFAGITDTQRVLDVGAGTGALTKELVSRGAQVSAAEPSPPFAQSFERRYPDVDVKATGAESLPWPDETFDAALAQLVVAFMDDAPAGIAEMHRVVKPGGVVAACMWDIPQMDMLAAIDRSVRALGGEANLPQRRYMGDQVATLFSPGAETELLTVEATYTGFDEFWDALQHSAGPVRTWLGTLDNAGLASAHEEFYRQLGSPHGSFTLKGGAWAVRVTRA